MNQPAHGTRPNCVAIKTTTGEYISMWSILRLSSVSLSAEEDIMAALKGTQSDSNELLYILANIPNADPIHMAIDCNDSFNMYSVGVNADIHSYSAPSNAQLTLNRLILMWGSIASGKDINEISFSTTVRHF